MNNLEGFGVENFVGKCMATMLGNANNITMISTASDGNPLSTLL
jgi:hypothetical protein